MKQFVLAVAVLLAIPAFAAVDFTGTWNGTLTVKREDGQTREMRAWAEFKQNGSVVSGAVGDGPADRHEISEATLKDNKLTFKVIGPQTLAFEVTIDGDQINGTGSRVGTSETAVLKLSRGK